MFDPGEHMSPESAEMLQRWIDVLGKVPFHRESDLHGRAHCARVLVHCIRVSEELGLSDDDRESLCVCAVYHDSRRYDDWYDVGHGDGGRRTTRSASVLLEESRTPGHPWPCASTIVRISKASLRSAMRAWVTTPYLCITSSRTPTAWTAAVWERTASIPGICAQPRPRA